MPGDWLTTAEVADIVGITRQRVQRLCRQDRIRCQRAGSLWLIPTGELETVRRLTARQR